MNEQSFGDFGRELKKEISAYIDARVEYTKLSAYEKIGRMTASASSILLILVFAFFTFLFLSATAAIFLGNILNSQVAGFAIIAGLDLLILLFFIFQRKTIEENITQRVIGELIKDREQQLEESDPTTT